MKKQFPCGSNSLEEDGGLVGGREVAARGPASCPEVAKKKREHQENRSHNSTRICGGGEPPWGGKKNPIPESPRWESGESSKKKTKPSPTRDWGIYDPVLPSQGPSKKVRVFSPQVGDAERMNERKGKSEYVAEKTVHLLRAQKSKFHPGRGRK